MDELTRNTSDLDVVILCGGLGTRLQSVLPNRPKVLAPIKGRAFIDILIENLINHGFRRFILTVSHLREQIIDHKFENRDKYDLVFCEEDTPLGTGGALKKSQHLIKSDPFLVTNGDSLCRLDFKDFLDFHHFKGGIASLALCPTRDRVDAGNVEISTSQKIVKFKEKNSAGLEKTQLISAGIYLMNKEIFSSVPNSDIFSLEYDLFPDLLKKDCYGFLTESDVIDIGTFERYTSAQETL